MWKWITASKTNKIIAATIVALLLAALGSAYDSFRHRSMLAEAKKAERLQEERADKLEEAAEVKEEAFRKALGANDVELKRATTEVRTAAAGVREAKDRLAEVEASRRALWKPPAVDNGDLVARFNRALEGLK